MKFHLYECIIKRDGHQVRGYIVAPSQDRAALVVIEHDEALGLTHDDFSLERVDQALKGKRRLGLDTLLRSAPVGFASFCEIGWIAHTAPVQQLKLYRTTNDDGGNVFAIAPNIDIAASVFTGRLGFHGGQPRMLYISDGMADLPDDQMRNLPQLLEVGPIGMVAWNNENGWSSA